MTNLLKLIDCVWDDYQFELINNNLYNVIKRGLLESPPSPPSPPLLLRRVFAPFDCWRPQTPTNGATVEVLGNRKREREAEGEGGGRIDCIGRTVAHGALN